MIIKFIDVYLSTELSKESAIHFLDKYLEDHIRDTSDFDLEHFLDIVEESGRFDIFDAVEEDYDLEYTQNDIDLLVDEITDEMYEEDEEDEEDFEDEEDEDELDDEDDEDDSGW